MSTSAYLVAFFDENGERIWGGRVHTLEMTGRGEVVPDPSYREVWLDTLYSGPSDDRFFRRAVPKGPGISEQYIAISTDDFDAMEVEIVEHE